MATEQDNALPDRPSRHGKMLGDALADIAAIGRQQIPEAPDLCATCAFRAGSVPNQSAGTGKVALDILLGIDTDDFACHHGMRESRPTKRCVGAILANQVPYRTVVEHVGRLCADIKAMSGDDTVRADFDRWWDSVDPQHEMTVHELASAYARAGAETKEPADGH